MRTLLTIALALVIGAGMTACYAPGATRPPGSVPGLDGRSLYPAASDERPPNETIEVPPPID